MRWICCLFAALLLLGRSAGVCAQFEAPENRPASGTTPVRLGESAVTLPGPWRFHVGDDAQWAKTSFGDASWETVDLSLPPADPDGSGGDLVPGWTTQGHPGYAGFAWYRLRVDVQGSHEPLELKMPDAVDDAYQVFVNGQMIGHFGDFHHRQVRAYAALPGGFRLPANLRNGPMLIAVRVWMDSATRFISPDAGGLRAPPVLGAVSAVAGQVRLDWDDRAHEVGSGFLETLVLLLVLVVAVTHFVLAPHEKAYVWLGLAVLVTLLANIILQVINFTTWLPQTPAILLRDVLLAPARIALWIFFWAFWFGLPRVRRTLYLTCYLTLLLAIVTAMLRPPLHGGLISLRASVALTPAVLWLKLGLAAILLTITVRGIRRNRAEGLLALPAVLLTAFASYQHELRFLHIPITFFVWGFMISVGQVSTTFSLLLVTLMGSRRFLLAQRRKVQWELEMQQARELQQVILPRALPEVPGLWLDSDYRPSREVGGDFFQVIPDRSDGSVLVLLGDVTGKGLSAGMLVALIVGSADALARENHDPEHLLTKLNERLCDRGFATATCLAMRITRDGFCTIVNAGHLPPYLNDQELEMEGALPLGTLPGADYTRLGVQLKEGDALTLMTDGIAEAQNEDGALFGFERVGAMMAGKATVHEVADAAAAFGQEDDILVLRVERRRQAQSLAPAA